MGKYRVDLLLDEVMDRRWSWWYKFWWKFLLGAKFTRVSDLELDYSAGTTDSANPPKEQKDTK